MKALELATHLVSVFTAYFGVPTISAVVPGTDPGTEALILKFPGLMPCFPFTIDRIRLEGPLESTGKLQISLEGIHGNQDAVDDFLAMLRSTNLFPAIQIVEELDLWPGDLVRIEPASTGLPRRTAWVVRAQGRRVEVVVADPVEGGPPSADEYSTTIWIDRDRVRLVDRRPADPIGSPSTNGGPR